MLSSTVVIWVYVRGFDNIINKKLIPFDWCLAIVVIYGMTIALLKGG